jgi:hypothetical protein
MAALTPKALDHRRRVLEHQEKMSSGQLAPATPVDPQLKMPLIAPAKPGSRPQQKRKKTRTRLGQQPELGDL